MLVISRLDSSTCWLSTKYSAVCMLGHTSLSNFLTWKHFPNDPGLAPHRGCNKQD